MGARYLDEEAKARFREKRNKTMLERYGVVATTNVERMKATKLERYGDENYNNTQKHEQTCLERYGTSHHNKVPEISNKIKNAKLQPETQSKYEATMLERYGETTPNLVPESREKYTQTLLEHYGVTNPLKNKDIYNQHIETMIRNGSFTKSEPEERIYKDLVEKFGSDDVIRQYSDDPRYPFNCDFYVRSEDQFIEVNFHPSHGPHLFDESNPEDVELLNNLICDDSEWSHMIIDCWTQRDVKKREYAQKNHLNYVVYYPEKK